MKHVSRIMLWLAVIGLVVPQVGQVSAADATSLNAPKASRQVTLVDVALTKDSALQGQLVDRQGTPKTNTKVRLMSGANVLGEAVTDEQGAFRVDVERGGVYSLSDGQATALVRVWTHQAAPPSAKNAVLMVSDSSLTRAALGNGGLDSVIGWAAIIGVTAAVIWAVVDDEDGS